MIARGSAWPESWCGILQDELERAGSTRGSAWQAVLDALERDRERHAPRVDCLVRGRRTQAPAFVVNGLLELSAPVVVIGEQLSILGSHVLADDI